MFPGPEDNVAEYYQQQVEMLEGFHEMDALAECGFLPGMSKVWYTAFRHLFCVKSNQYTFQITEKYKREKD